jgi:hypothetical protein
MPLRPEHQLYNAACELLDAAREARAAAGRDGVGEAIPATVACLGVALEELAIATAAMTRQLRRDDRGSAARSLERLTDELLGTAQACDGARRAVAASVVVSP